jgi:hypothetical protein
MVPRFRSRFAAQAGTVEKLAAARSITLPMQAIINKVAGFKAWYAPRIELQEKDPLSQFFNEYRNVSIHIGDTVVRGGGSFIDKDGNRVRQYFFMPISSPSHRNLVSRESTGTHFGT